jgi:hypothetical protein
MGTTLAFLKRFLGTQDLKGQIAAKVILGVLKPWNTPQVLLQIPGTEV